MINYGREVKKPNQDPLIEGSNNNILISNNCRVTNLAIEVFGNNNTIIIEEYCTLKGLIHIRGNGTKIVIGRKTTWQHASIIATEGKDITIGEDCMFSIGITLRNGDGHSIMDKLTGERVNQAKNINIGNHTWLGQGVLVLKGVTIADHCVIAAGAIVTKSIESENCIVAGNPAKVVRRNIQWSRYLD